MAGINAAGRIKSPVRPFLSAFRNLQLDSKLALSLIVIGMIGFIFMFAALTAVINPSFSSLESRSVASHVERTRAALDEYSARVETAVRDYGAWDDSFTYLNAPNQQFETGTFSVLAMTNLDVNGMAYVKFDGTVLFSRWVDIENQVEVSGLGQEFEALAARMAKEPRVRNSESVRFYARFGDRVAALSAARVVRTDGSGTPTGFVVMAREICPRRGDFAIKSGSASSSFISSTLVSYTIADRSDTASAGSEAAFSR